MAGNTFTEKIKIQLQGAKKAASNGKKVESSLKKIQKAAVMAGGSFFAAQGLIEGFKHIAKLSLETEKVGTAFSNLGKHFDISRSQLHKLRDAVDGTMNDMELMTLANQAMSLGVVDNVDAMAQLFDTAQRLGKGLGQDTKSAVESLTTGIGRGSIMMLDNLGIIVDTQRAYDDYAEKMGITNRALDDQEKKLAFNEAAMGQATEAVKKLGDEQLSTSESLDKMSTSWETSFSTAMSMNRILASEVIDVFTGATGEAGEITSSSWAEEFVALFDINEIDVFANEALGAFERLHAAHPAGPDKQFEKFKEAWEGLVSQEGLDGFIALNELFMAFTETQRFSNTLSSDQSKFLDVYVAKFNELMPLEAERLQLQIAIANTPTVAERELEFYAPYITQLEKDIVLRDQRAEQTAQEIQDARDLEKARISETKTLQKQIDMSIALGMATDNVAEAAGKASTAYIADYVKKILAEYIFTAFKGGGFWGGLGAVATGAAFSSTLTQMLTSGKVAAEGMNEIVTEPTLILAGEAGAEYVDIDPLTNEGGGGGKGSTIIFQGNVMSQDFIEAEAIPMIKEALRKGGDIGIG